MYNIPVHMLLYSPRIEQPRHSMVNSHPIALFVTTVNSQRTALYNELISSHGELLPHCPFPHGELSPLCFKIVN